MSGTINKIVSPPKRGKPAQTRENTAFRNFLLENKCTSDTKKSQIVHLPHPHDSWHATCKNPRHSSWMGCSPSNTAIIPERNSSDHEHPKRQETHHALVVPASRSTPGRGQCSMLPGCSAAARRRQGCMGREESDPPTRPPTRMGLGLIPPPPTTALLRKNPFGAESTERKPWPKNRRRRNTRRPGGNP